MPNVDQIKGRTRRVGGGNRATTSAGNIVKILPADPTRVAIIISCESNGIHIWGDSSGQTTYGSFIVKSGDPALVLDVETFGALVTGDLYADATTTPCAVRILAIVDTLYQGNQGYAGVS